MPLERIATLEAKMDEVIRRLTHQDECVDKLKRQVWQAAGALTVIVLAANFFTKGS